MRDAGTGGQSRREVVPVPGRVEGRQGPAAVPRDGVQQECQVVRGDLVGEPGLPGGDVLDPAPDPAVSGPDLAPHRVGGRDADGTQDEVGGQVAGRDDHALGQPAQGGGTAQPGPYLRIVVHGPGQAVRRGAGDGGGEPVGDLHLGVDVVPVRGDEHRDLHRARRVVRYVLCPRVHRLGGPDRRAPDRHRPRYPVQVELHLNHS